MTSRSRKPPSNSAPSARRNSIGSSIPGRWSRLMSPRTETKKEHAMSQLDKGLPAVGLLRGRRMRRVAVPLVAITALAAVVGHLTRASGQEGGGGAQIFVDKMHSGYRDW